MYKPEISLFHHPTTTVFVDDSEDFLYSIALGVDRLPYRSFCDPEQGLAYLNHFANAYDTPARQLPFTASASLEKLFAQVDPKLVDLHRYAEPSVLVVDYSMPGTNGLELCSQITNPNVKKVLLTGMANRKVVIDALNTEVIDFYISKRESHLSRRLRGVISHLEVRYFQDLLGWSRDNEVKGFLPHLYDPAFADFFEDVVESLKAIEHYPLMGGMGFCLMSGYGETNHLVVYSEKELSACLRTLNLCQLSEPTRDQLANRQLIPYQIPAGSEPLPLRERELFTPTIVAGKQTYYCALVEEQNLPRHPLGVRTSYYQFLSAPPLRFQERRRTRKQQ